MYVNMTNIKKRFYYYYYYYYYNEINGRVVRDWFRADLSSVWDPLTCYLPKRCMKDGLFDI